MTELRIDFAKLLDEIAYLLGDDLPGSPQHVPVSQYKLAEAVGYPRETVRMWLEGSEPRHADGEKLIEHWCRLTGKARTFVPTALGGRRVSSSWDARKDRRKDAESPGDRSLEAVWNGRPKAHAA